MVCCSSECVLTFFIQAIISIMLTSSSSRVSTLFWSYDRTKLPRLSAKWITKQLEDIPLATLIAMYFQHDGTPSHYSRHLMQHLSDTSPNRGIGRGSTINWPPRSPDLTPLDFCIWGLMKSEVYRKKCVLRSKHNRLVYKTQSVNIV